MADQLNVDVDALELFASQLDVTRSQFDATVKDTSAAGSGLGNARLASALADFEQRWRVHREVLDSYFSALSRMVSDSANTLRQRDVELAKIHENAVMRRQMGPS
jgi:hypothetical protein